MGFTDAPVKNKAVFKKRALRPWQPTVFEGTEEAQVVVNEALSRIQENQLEMVQRQLNATLEIKNKEKQEISHTLATIDDHRITLGGFLKPKDILMVTEHASLHKTASLMSELKEKEQEIMEITQHLKISQAEEFAKRAESARLVEEKARQAAEEKAIYALKQAQHAAEQSRVSEEQVRTLEQIRSKLEQGLYDLEQRLKLSQHTLQEREQSLQSETELRQKVEQTAVAQYHSLNNELKGLTQKLREESQSKQNLEASNAALSFELQNERKAKHLLESNLQNSLANLQSIETSLKHEKTLNYTLEARAKGLEAQVTSLENENTKLLISLKISEDKQSELMIQAEKLAQIASAERNLRQLFETRGGLPPILV